MREFTPELGQMAWSNTPWKRYEMEYHVERLLTVLGEAVESRGLGDTPAGNTGNRYENDTFAMRAYCWCDGYAEEHKDGCPPNFEWKGRDFAATWYKYIGRSGTQSREMGIDEAVEMFTACFQSLPAREARHA